MRAIVRWSVDNPVAVNLLFVVLLVAGLSTWASLPQEVMPAIDLDQVEIVTEYPGAPAEEVERLVTERLEEAIADVQHITEVRSLSRQGVSTILVDVELGIDPDRVARRIETEVRRVDELPEEVEDEPKVAARRSEFPVIILNLAGAADPGETKLWVDRLKREIQAVPGVASVEVSGLTDPQIWVECDPRRLVAHDLTTVEVVEAVRAWAVDVPGGTAESRRAGTLMRTVGQGHGAAELEDAPLRPGLRLGDVAEVREARRRPTSYSRFNGRPSVNLIIQKTRDGNVTTISESVRELIEERRAALPDGLSIHYTTDTATYVKARFRTVYQSGAMAICIILAILYLLLNGRIALVTALGVPTSVAGAVVLMSAVGLSLNLFTLFAFILVLGLVVDDAIILSENIYRRIEEGQAPLEAAKDGAAEVAWPVTVTVLTTIAAFFPLVFLPGLFGRYMAIIPMVVTMTLLVSLFEALVILPSHVAEVSHREPAPTAEAGHAAPRLEAWKARYQRLLDRILDWRWAVLAGVTTATLIAVTAAATWMPFLLIHNPDIPLFLARVEAPQDAPLDETLRVVGEVERAALSLPAADVRAVTSWVGFFYRPNEETEVGRNLGEVWVELIEFDQRERSGFETLEELRAKLAVGVPGARRVTLTAEDGLPTAPDVEIFLQGDDWPAVRRAADGLMARLREIPGVTDVKDDDPPGRPERRVRVVAARAELLGVDTRSLGLALQAALEGIRATSFRRGDEEVEILVKLPEHDRLSGDFELERLAVPARADGRTRMIPLSEVAEIEDTLGRTEVRRRDRRRSLTITAEVDSDRITPSRVEARLAGDLAALPAGVEPASGGKSRELREILGAVIKALGVAMLFIYFLLGTLFRSFLQPFAIMATIPFAVLGVILGFALTGQPLDVLAMIGTVALAGIVVNDSLVLIDFINKRRREGTPRRQAILEAGAARLRPILLTTITTVGGLLPLALTSTGQAAALSPMADAMCWGLSLATGLTLVVVPCAYAAVEDVAEWLRGRMG